ncbi:flavodoxin family protein [Sedimentibacter sp. B4]|uniref:flavodoxin family protein n=1 Tax=Sedimentibacter sp. B4 TaxID=304766 RepID=UPI00030606B0|nr:NAD(P)H-dependent oxidoreductase [Sedimentibacter sp. B4]
MKVAVVYGTEHKGSTYNIAQLFLKKLENEITEVTEFFLPRDMSNFCRGCALCFMKNENLCPDFDQVNKIKETMEKADLLIFTSPVYAYHASGQMKTLLDHFAYQWMVHRPNKTMFKKMALVVTTAAGAGMRKTNTDMIDSLSFWGVGKIYKFGKGVAAINWDGVKKENKDKIEKKVDKISSKIISTSKNVTPNLKVRILFYLMRYAQRGGGFNPADNNYWKEQGWLEGARPW